MHITAQGPPLRNDLYCVEWDVKLYYTIPYLVKSGHQYSFSFILARIVRFMSGGICFISFYLLIYFFIPDNDVIVPLLECFVWCITHSFPPFSYEDKHLRQHWTTHTLTHPLTSGIHDSKHAYVPSYGGHFKHMV